MPARLHRSAPLLLLAMTCACGLISFDISESLPAATLAAGPDGTSLAALQAPVTIGAQDTGPADSAKLSSLSFTSSSTAPFDFVQEIHLFVDSPGLPEVEIANLVPVPTGQVTISLNVVPGVQLLPYLQAGCTLRSGVTGNAPAEDFTFTGELVAHVGI
jgi:hypothetical protein